MSVGRACERRLRNVLYGRASLESVLKGDEKASNCEKISVKGEEKASVKGEEKASVKGEAKASVKGEAKESGLETASATETAPVTGEETAPLPTTVDGMPDVNEASTLEEIDAYLEQLVSMEPAKPTQLCYTCGSSEHDQAHCPESWRVIEHVDEKEAEKEEKEAEKEEKEMEEKEMEEKEEKEAEAEKTETTETKTQTESDLLLNWTANPTETDRILHAIPVCAPYAALNEYAFHVKMTVGKMKKGAMAKSVVDYWLKSKIPEEQKKSILQIPVEDISAIIMNNAKVVLPGGRK